MIVRSPSPQARYKTVSLYQLLGHLSVSSRSLVPVNLVEDDSLMPDNPHLPHHPRQIYLRVPGLNSISNT